MQFSSFNFLYWITVFFLKSDSWGATSKRWSRQHFSWRSIERKPYNQGLQAFPLRCPPGFLDIPTSPADSDKTLIYWKDPLLRRCTLGKSEFNALQYMCRHGVEIHSSPVLVCIFVHAFCNESTQVILSIWYFVSLPTSCQEHRLLLRQLRLHNRPMLVFWQVGKGHRQAGTHTICERREAQVALTYSVVLAVLAY